MPKMTEKITTPVINIVGNGIVPLAHYFYIFVLATVAEKEDDRPAHWQNHLKSA